MSGKEPGTSSEKGSSGANKAPISDLSSEMESVETNNVQNNEQAPVDDFYDGEEMTGMEDEESYSENEHTSSIANNQLATNKNQGFKLGLLASQRKQADIIEKRKEEARVARARREAGINENHMFFIEMIAFYLNKSVKEIMPNYLDYPENYADTQQFIDGSRTLLMFYHQEMEVPLEEECGTRYPSVDTKHRSWRFRAQTGKQLGIFGQALYFVRPAPSSVEFDLPADTSFGVLNVQGNRQSLLLGILEQLKLIYIPMMTATANWGNMDMSKHSQKRVRENFISDIIYSMKCLKSSNDHMEKIIFLSQPSVVGLDLNKVQNAEAWKYYANHSGHLSKTEKLVGKWCDELEMEINKADRLRKEEKITGPRDELEHWKQLSIKYSCLSQQITSHYCRTAVAILVVARSKILTRWKKLDKLLTDRLNEAKDNVKFLYTLEGYCSKLYQKDLTSMTDKIPSLVHAIRMVNSISDYYNTSDRMMALFIKVTNQIILACRDFLQDLEPDTKFLELSPQAAQQKLQVCCAIYDRYVICCKEEKQSADMNGERKFDFSEMYVFSDFHAFIKRIEKVSCVIQIISEYSPLMTHSMENQKKLQDIAKAYGKTVRTMFAISYDIFDNKSSEFEQDFDTFTKAMDVIEVSLKEFFDEEFTRSTHTLTNLEMIKRFEDMDLPCLNVAERYVKIIKRVYNDINAAKEIYTESLHSPPTPRNCPPTSGRVQWGRQLYNRLADVIKVLQERRPSLLPLHPELVDLYNETVYIFVQYEQIYYSAWMHSVCNTASVVSASPILAKKRATMVFEPNINESVWEIIQDSKIIAKLGLRITNDAFDLLCMERKLKENFSVMSELLKRFYETRAMIPPIFANFFIGPIDRVHAAFQPGIYSVTWTCLHLKDFFNTVESELDRFRLLVDRVIDIHEFRIKAVLEQISVFDMTTQPAPDSGEIWTIDEMIAKHQPHLMGIGDQLELLSQHVERGVLELIQIFTDENRLRIDKLMMRYRLKKQRELNAAQGFVNMQQNNSLEIIDDPNALPPMNEKKAREEHKRRGFDKVLISADDPFLDDNAPFNEERSYLASLVPQGILGRPEKSLLRTVFSISREEFNESQNNAAKKEGGSGDGKGGDDTIVMNTPEQKFVLEVVELFKISNLSFIDCVHKALKTSFDILQKRVYHYSLEDKEMSELEKMKLANEVIDANLLFRVELDVPNIQLQPPIHNIDKKFDILIRAIVGATQRVVEWGQDRSAPEPFLELLDEMEKGAGELDCVEKQARSGAPRTDQSQTTKRTFPLWMKVFGSATIDPELKGTRNELLHLISARIKKAQEEAVDDDPEVNIMQQLAQIAQQGLQKEDADQAIENDEVQMIVPQVVKLRSIYDQIKDQKELTKYTVGLRSSLELLRKTVEGQVKHWLTSYHYLWLIKRTTYCKETAAEGDTSLFEYQFQFERFYTMIDKIDAIEDRVQIGPVILYTRPMKDALIDEARAWQLNYAFYMHEKFNAAAVNIMAFIEDIQQKLAHKTKDLVDVKELMATMSAAREKYYEIDIAIDPIEEAFSYLSRLEAERLEMKSIPEGINLEVKPEEYERVDTLRSCFNKMMAQLDTKSDELLFKQKDYRDTVQQDLGGFEQALADELADFDKTGPLEPGISSQEAYDRLYTARLAFEALGKRYDSIVSGQQLLGLTPISYPELEKKRKDIAMLQKLYSLYNEVNQTIQSYETENWVDLNADYMASNINDLVGRARFLEHGWKDWKAYQEMKAMLDRYKRITPLLEMMKATDLQDRHWGQISKLTHTEFAVHSDDFRVKDVVKAPLVENRDDIETICTTSQKEKDIDKKLREIAFQFEAVPLVFAEFKNRGQILLRASDVSEQVVLLEDAGANISSLMTNSYAAHFRDELMKWSDKISGTSSILELWLKVQNLWAYLEAVFVGGDIARQLPSEAKRFANIDKSWCKVMQKAHDEKYLIQTCTGDDTVKNLLVHLFEQLEACQKSLSGYLGSKRLIFPRFFFVSDAVLLEILGKANNPHSITEYMKSVTEDVNNLFFHEKAHNKIISFESSARELVYLAKPVIADSFVEDWLAKFLIASGTAIYNLIADSCTEMEEDEQFKLIPFLKKQIAQIALVCLQIMWTRDAEIALSEVKFNSTALKKTNKKFAKILNTLIKETTDDTMTKSERRKFETLITIHVHQVDIFDQLTQMRINSAKDFEWLKQCRFYNFIELDELHIYITDVFFTYGNEMLGNSERLVITPLTDRCYITIAQALKLSFGAAPAGPAGTGKTETTKDMAKSLGKFCVVFNCSDQMDYRGLGRLYQGLAMSNSWGCFDEFNRIELPVLSVAAQQVAIILTAKKERKNEFYFDDPNHPEAIPMFHEFAIVITMNPTYAGRNNLPENLKMLMRGVAMMVPDRQIIIRVKLASIGFQENVILSQKFMMLYALCEGQLSKQVHYDFGLRNILSVCRTLGGVKRMNPNDKEVITVAKVLRDMNLSKMIDEDEPLFISLMADIFPNIVIQSRDHSFLETFINAEIESAGLINWKPWKLKTVQLYETQEVRHGIMILGPSGAGKTCCSSVLLKAMTSLAKAKAGPKEIAQPYVERRMNPKSITAAEMFGKLDVATEDWTDGIFSNLWRRTLLKPLEHCWLTLDGPVDTLWIENLNSVLDDNKLLTLANGDRIPMAPRCKLVFEVHNVENASPATISRNGMVFMSSSVLTWEPLVDSWLLTQKKEYRDTVRTAFECMFPPLLEFFKVDLVSTIELHDCNIVNQTTRLLNQLLKDERRSSGKPPHKDSQLILLLTIFCFMWSFGAVLEMNGRKKFDAFLRELNVTVLAKTIPEDPVTFPDEDEEFTIFDYFIDTNQMDPSMRWVNWSARVNEYVFPKVNIDFSTVLIPNIDNVRTTFLIDTIAKQKLPLLLIGESGTAKTVMIKSYLRTLEAEYETMKWKSFNFSYATTPGIVQNTIESYIEKKTAKEYAPPAGKNLVVFIDDINMPVINAWGDQVTNEITRQLIENGGFYSLLTPGDFWQISNIQIMAAMGHPEGKRNDIPERLKRHFTIFNCPLPSNVSVDRIFSVMASGFFNRNRGYKGEIVQMTQQLVPVTRKIWQVTKDTRKPTPAKFHYVFNLRDLSRIWQGITQCHCDEMTNVKFLLNVWKHEISRVIGDKFTTPEDKKWLEDKIAITMEEELNMERDILEKQPCFVHFLQDPMEYERFTGGGARFEQAEAMGLPLDDLDPNNGVYDYVVDRKVLIKRIEHFMLDEENVRKGVTLTLFEDAVSHITKITRILFQKGGHMLLVGIGGSGKRSLTQLASLIGGSTVLVPQMKKGYGMGDLQKTLQDVYARAGGGRGGGATKVTFVFTEDDIKDENFLEYMNNILSSGEVSNLYPKDELDEVLQNMVGPMKKQLPKHPPTPENLYEFFLKRAKDNLHVILCFSPIGEKFRSRAQKFPGLVSGCTINWFQKWPKEALHSVAKEKLATFEMKCTSAVKDRVVKMLSTVHSNANDQCQVYFEKFRRSTAVTPKTFLLFLESYKEFYTRKMKEVEERIKQMTQGLRKLAEAEDSVAILQIELDEQKKVVKIEAQKMEGQVREVKKQQEIIEKLNIEISKKKDEAEEQQAEIAIIAGHAQKELAEAEPALRAALESLDNIQPAAINGLKALKKPPPFVGRLLDVVLVLGQRPLTKPVIYEGGFHYPVPNWSEAQRVMGGGVFGDFMTFLKTFVGKKENPPFGLLNDEVLELMEPYMDSAPFELHVPDKDKVTAFTKKIAMKSTKDIADLCTWSSNMCVYYDVSKKVKPLQDEMFRQEALLKRAQKKVEDALELQRIKMEELDEVRKDYDSKNRALQALVDKADACEKKLITASNLIDGLSGEKIRWTATSETLKKQVQSLVGDTVTCTAFMMYSGPFNQEFRTKSRDSISRMMDNENIPQTHGLSIIDFMIDMALAAEWNQDGLPNDDLSIQNGILSLKSPRYPLLIDPQGQGRAWIINLESRHSDALVKTFLNKKTFDLDLKTALSKGSALLIEDLNEELDPSLNNVLERNYTSNGTKVKIIAEDFPIHSNFRLYMTTKLANPTYSPEVCARCTVINFTVTMKGLEDQLLGKVIGYERNDLEQQKQEAVKIISDSKKKIKNLEDDLLNHLNSSSGDLLDDTDLINLLNTTKITAISVNEKLTEAAENEIKINSARESYRPVATRGSTLYFLITEMSLVNHMYQTALKQFLVIFQDSMIDAPTTAVQARRIENIISQLTMSAFKYCVRGYYEEHSFMFTLLLALKIDMQRRDSKTISPHEFDVLIKGGAALNMTEQKPFKWLSDVAWLNLNELKTLSIFTPLLPHMLRHTKEWKEWYDHDHPEEYPLPGIYRDSLTTFQKLLVVRCICPDRTVEMARKYVTASLGKEYNEAVLLDLESVSTEYDNRTPLICLLSIGSDPSEAIKELAKRAGKECYSVSMGQGQEVRATAQLKVAFATGNWVLLQNCHLALNFMEDVFQTMIDKHQVIEKEFRIWITAEVHPKFNISLLQISVKFTAEPPQGIAAGLTRTYQTLSPETLDYHLLPQWKALLFVLNYLHTVVQERKKFGPLGWNVPYEFNQCDFAASLQFTQNHLDEIELNATISWSTIRYIVGEIQYGGRITDNFDMRLMNTYCKLWIGAETVSNQSFKFFEGFTVCHAKTHEGIQEFLDALPRSDPPQALGLHANADITYQSRTAKNILDTIVNIQPKESSGDGGETREDVVKRLAQDILEKTPEDFNKFEMKGQLQALGILAPMTIFLRQEVDRLQRVLNLLRTVLNDLKLAIDGISMMTDDLRDVLDSLFDARVPPAWIRLSWPSATIGFWFSDLVGRYDQFKSWLKSGKPACFWMTGFFNPQGFLTAMKQESCRENQWPLDSVHILNDVTKSYVEEMNHPPPHGVYIHGLFLDGAGWDRKRMLLCEQSPKTIFSKLPVVWIYATSKKPEDKKLYVCPIYKKPQRTDAFYIASIFLKMDLNDKSKTPEHWVLRGVAALCDTK